jgi:hypothetical protein
LSGIRSSFRYSPGVRTRQAGKKIRRIVELKVGTALSADRMRPSR